MNEISDVRLLLFFFFPRICQLRIYSGGRCLVMDMLFGHGFEVLL